ncbi:MAG: hypothetical protein LBB65_05460 [Burkholderiales bacterium]|jgi:hypothetical protein|nr:hypothetical protein [Burkholderiales bacterium]
MTLPPAPSPALPPFAPPPLPEAPAPAPVDVASGRFLGGLLLLFIASLLICTLVWLAWTIPGAWFSGASVNTWTPKDITVARGALVGVEPERDQAYFAPETNGLAVLMVNAHFPARDYPVLDWTISNLPDDTAAKLLWRSDYAPNAQRQLDLEVENGRLSPVNVARESGWVGNIQGFAIALQLPTQFSTPQSFTVANIRAHPMDAPETLWLRIKEWNTFADWRGTSFFRLNDPGTVPLSLLVLAALALLFIGAAALYLWRRWSDRYLDFPRAMPHHWLYAGVALFCLGWMVLDLRWTIQLTQQAAQTWQTYGGKNWTQKHLAAEDGALFAFIEKARAELPTSQPANHVRIFIMTDVAYLKSRAAYHLYPYQVFYDFNATQPDARQLRPGDYLLVFQQRGVQYDAAQKKIRLPSGVELSADAKLIDAGSALFELTP